VVLSTAVLGGCGSGGTGPADGTAGPEVASSAAPSPATAVPAEDGAVQTAVADLQAAAPAVAVGAFAGSTGVGSPEWSQAQAELGDACEALGAPLTIAPFTGG
jgi:hypothetical protein